jgi:hypothetical protein
MAKISFGINYELRGVWLDEATKDAVADIGFCVTRVPLDDLEFERRRQSGEWEVRHSDGSITPVRRNCRDTGGDPNGAAG